VIITKRRRGLHHPIPVLDLQTFKVNYGWALISGNAGIGKTMLSCIIAKEIPNPGLFGSVEHLILIKGEDRTKDIPV